MQTDADTQYAINRLQEIKNELAALVEDKENWRKGNQFKYMALLDEEERLYSMLWEKQGKNL